MSDDLEPLPGDVAALLERARGHLGPSPEVRAQLRSRLGPHLAPSVLAGGAPPAPPAPGLRTMLAHRLALALLSFGLGAGATAWHDRHLPPEVRYVTAAAPVPAEPLPSPVAPAPVALAPAPATPAPAAAPPHRRASVAAPAAPAVAPPPAAPAEGRDEQLAEERTLLEKGRTALTRGDLAGALGAVEDHARRFPNGQLAEERQALRIQVLVAGGKGAEARAALGDFRAQFPKSMLYRALQRELDANSGAP